MNKQLAKLAQALKTLGVKNADEADPALVEKVLKSMKGEASSAPDNLIGKGKNLEVLQNAKTNMAQKAQADLPPSYPKNVGADEVNHRLVNDPNGFTMVPEGTGLPVVRGNTMPAAKPVSKALIPEVVDDMPGPMLPAVRKQTDPAMLVDDIAQASGMSGRKKAALVAGATGAGVLGTGMMLNSDDKKSEAMPPLLAQAAIAATPVIMDKVLNGGNKEQGPARAPSDVVSSEAAKAPAPAPEEMDYLKQLMSAQEQKGELDFVDNMLMAGTTVGNALATPDKKADYTAVNALKEQNNQGIENVKQKMKTEAEAGDLGDVQALRDPKSEMSKTLRGMLSELGYPVGDNVSGKQLKDMGINVYNLLAQKEAREAARLNRDAQMGNMNLERTKQSVDRGIQNWKKGKAYESYQSTKSGLDAVNDAIANGDKIAAGTAFMRFAKTAQGDDSVVKSEDMKTLLGGTNYTPKAYTEKMMDLAEGKNITDRELGAMKRIMERLVKSTGTKAFIDGSGHRQKIKNAGLDESEYINPLEAEEIDKYDPSRKEEADTEGGDQMVKVTEIATGRSKMMPASKAAKAPKDKYKVGQ